MKCCVIFGPLVIVGGHDVEKLVGALAGTKSVVDVLGSASGTVCDNLNIAWLS